MATNMTMTMRLDRLSALALSIIVTSPTSGAAQQLAWAEHIGGGGDDSSQAVAVDNDGNLYVAGEYSGRADFDPGPGSFFLSSVPGSTSIFLQKLTPSGQLLWAKRVGNRYFDEATSLKLDEFGNAY